MTTVLDVLQKGTAYLQQKGIEDSRTTMQRLLEHLLQIKTIELYLQFDYPLSDQQLAVIREQMMRRAKREPLQHIIGSVDFFHCTFSCDKRALIPRPETEELADKLSKRLLSNSVPSPFSLLDMGTGSGCLGLSIACHSQEHCHTLTLCDLSEEALDLAKENLQRTPLNPHTQVSLLKSDLFNALEDQRFNAIIANLPYIPQKEHLEPEVIDYDPHMALFGGKDGLDIVRRCVHDAKNFLAPQGVLALEVGHDQGDTVFSMLDALGCYAHISLESDLSGIKRFLFAQLSH